MQVVSCLVTETIIGAVCVMYVNRDYIGTGCVVSVNRDYYWCSLCHVC